MGKKGAVIAGILVISLATNFYYFFRPADSVACDNKGRYSEEEVEGALRISEAEGHDLVNHYRENYPPDQNGNRPTGYVFTKRMFDEIFVDPEFNSVTLDLVTYNENVSIVVKGFKTRKTKIDGSAEGKVYVIKSFCPVDCSVW